MSASQKTPVLFLGATGYFGGSVLARLLAHPTAEALEITALARTEQKAKQLQAFGLKTAVGTIQDLELLETLASQAHIVLSIINADDDPHMEAILRGLKKRHDTTGDLPILIHTSGTGVFISQANGNFTTEEVWDDANPDQIETLPHEALHRSVDELVVAADKDGYARTYVLLPSTIYGKPSNPLADAGVQNTHSIQIPLMIKKSIERGQAGKVGKGVPLWNHISNDDATDLFIILYDAATAPGSTIGHGREGLYIGENGTFSWGEVCDEIAKVLHEKGASKTPVATTFTPDELVKYFGSEYFGNLLFGSNTIARSTRSRALGWTPKHTKADLLASIRVDVEDVLNAQ